MLGLNLTKIESRPIPDRKFEHYFEYFFYLDFIGSVRAVSYTHLDVYKRQFQRNVDAFKEGGVIVLLDTPLRVLQLRLKNDRNRPLLQRPDRFRFIRELHQKRMPLYRRAADVVIPTKGSPNAVCRQVLQALEEKNLTNS